jgi:hypothetical protein
MGAVLSSPVVTPPAVGDECSLPIHRVRDASGAVHERNPLGGNACLACSRPFPCPTAAGGEQLPLPALCGPCADELEAQIT